MGGKSCKMLLLRVALKLCNLYIISIFSLRWSSKRTVFGFWQFEFWIFNIFLDFKITAAKYGQKETPIIWKRRDDGAKWTAIWDPETLATHVFWCWAQLIVFMVIFLRSLSVFVSRWLKLHHLWNISDLVGNNIFLWLLGNVAETKNWNGGTFKYFQWSYRQTFDTEMTLHFEVHVGSL